MPYSIRKPNIFQGLTYSYIRSKIHYCMSISLILHSECQLNVFACVVLMMHQISNLKFRKSIKHHFFSTFIIGEEVYIRESEM